MSSREENDVMNEVQSRYGYLLKPIRDLCKNWEINIASELEEYLNEVEEIKISFDGGQTVMNFAEAALLIQGSACIYSKKVEYLYALVYQTLHLIASKSKPQQAPSVDDQGVDKDVSSHEQKEEFLLLDDIKEAKDIDLKENSVQLEATPLIPRTPITLITFDDSRKGSALLSLKGDVLGNRNDFKMNSCSIHLGSGTLLLDMSNLDSVQGESFQRSAHTTTFSQDNGVHQDLVKNRPDEMHDACDNGEAAATCDYSPGGAYFDGDLPCSPLAVSVVERDAMSNRRKLRERNEELQDQNIVERKMKEQKDPWETLDPHDPNGGIEKPFKKGRPFKIPLSARDNKVSVKKRKRKCQEDSLVKDKLIPIAEFCRLAYHSQVEKLPKNTLKTLTHHEFEYIYWIEFRRRQIFEKKHRTAMAAMGIPEHEIKLEPFTDDFDENNNEETAEDGFGYEMIVKRLFLEDQDSEFDDDSNDDNVFSGNMNDMPADGVEPMALEETDELVVSSYEELVQKYVQGFLVQAQRYVQETDLSRRVMEWEKRVAPKLEDEDLHRPYDIHKYGENLLARFEDGPIKSFEEVVPNQEPWEVCRYFLASLQLANNHNVEIGLTKDDSGNKMDCMQLKLLHRTPAHHGIAQYRAPSVLT